MRPLALGNIAVSVVKEVDVRFKAAMFFPGKTEEEAVRHREWLTPRFMDDAGNLLLSIHTYVIRAGRQTVLVDTCFGNDKDRGGRGGGHMRQGPFLDDLRKAGVDPNTVDYVLCTHLHVDHVGWNTRLESGRWVPSFPRAKYLFSRTDWEYWLTHEGAGGGQIMEDSVRPIVDAGQAILVEGDHEVADGVRIVPLPGHTPGHVSVHLAGGGRRAIMTGDMMHHAVQVAEPDWSSLACYDARASALSRRQFFQQYGDSGVIVLPAHFPAPTAGYIVSHGEGWRYRPLGS